MEPTSDTKQEINIFDLDALREEALTIATQQEYFTSNGEIDAFRHIYTNAMVTWQGGIAEGALYTAVLGTGYEAIGLARVIGQDTAAALLKPLGIDIISFGIGYEAQSSLMDIYNNHIGFSIGSIATSEQDIIRRTADAVRYGRAYTDPEQIGEALSRGANDPFGGKHPQVVEFELQAEAERWLHHYLSAMDR